MNSNAKKIINDKLEELSKSKFRSSFHLRNYMKDYIDDKGNETEEIYKELKKECLNYECASKNKIVETIEIINNKLA